MCKLARLVQVQAPLGSHGILAGAYSPHHQPSHSVLFTPDIDDSQVQPLRIHKGGTPIASPTRGEAHPRPLSDISPTEHRRNSPSFKQTTKVCNALRSSSTSSLTVHHSEDGCQRWLFPVPALSLQHREQPLSTALLARTRSSHTKSFLDF